MGEVLGFQDEPEFLEDSLALPGFSAFTNKFVSSEDEFVDSDDVDVSNGLPQSRPSMLHTSFMDSKPLMGSAGLMKRESRRRVQYGWLHKLVITTYSSVLVSSYYSFPHLSASYW